MRSALVALLLALAPLPVAAAPKELDPDTQQAKQHFQAGRQLYEQEDYVHAVDEFIAARKFKKLPDFDFNIGKCYEKLGNLEEAIKAYESFAEVVVGPDAVTAKAHIAELQVQLAEYRRIHPVRVTPSPVATAPLPPSLTPPPPVEEKPFLARHLPALAVGAGALVLGVAGTVLWVTVKSSYDSLNNSCAPRCAPTDWASLQTRADVAYALWGVAAVAVAADVVLWVLDARKSGRPERVWLVPSLGAGSLGVAAGGRF